VNCDVFTPLLVVAFNRLEPLVLLQVLPLVGCYHCVFGVVTSVLFLYYPLVEWVVVHLIVQVLQVVGTALDYYSLQALHQIHVLNSCSGIYCLLGQEASKRVW
jgi:hypothetical protein